MTIVTYLSNATPLSTSITVAVVWDKQPRVLRLHVDSDFSPLSQSAIIFLSLCSVSFESLPRPRHESLDIDMTQKVKQVLDNLFVKFHFQSCILLNSNTKEQNDVEDINLLIQAVPRHGTIITNLNETYRYCYFGRLFLNELILLLVLYNDQYVFK